MNIFKTISFKTEDIGCYYLCKYTYEIFKEKKEGSHNLLISKNLVEKDMTKICKDCYDLDQ